MQGCPFFLPSYADRLIPNAKKGDIVDFDICIESFNMNQFFMTARYNNVRPTKLGRDDRLLPYEMTVRQFIDMFVEVCEHRGLTNAQEHERFVRLSREFRYDPGAMEYNARFNIVKETARQIYNKKIGVPQDRLLGYRKTDIAAVVLDDDCMFWTLSKEDAVELTDDFVLAMSEKYDTPVYDVLYTLKYYPKYAYYRIFYNHIVPTLLDRNEACERNREQVMRPLTMLEFIYSFAPGLVPDEHLDMYKDCWHLALLEFRKN